MCEPALSARPLVEPEAVRGDGINPQAAIDQDPGLFARPSPDGDDAPHLHGPHEDGDQSLHTELSQLRRAMATRPVIDQACGVLMATFGLSGQTAWAALVATSQNTNTKLRRLAGDLVGSVQGEPLPKEVREQLATAIAKVTADRETPGTTY